jgi:hypothetical protein
MAETIEDRLKKIASSDTSTEEDGRLVQYVLRSMGFPNAVVVYGVAYPLGSGRPMSVHQAAKTILDAVEIQKKKRDKNKLEDTGI